jgi:hypothetical protein
MEVDSCCIRIAAFAMRACLRIFGVVGSLH